MSCQFLAASRYCLVFLLYSSGCGFGDFQGETAGALMGKEK